MPDPLKDGHFDTETWATGPEGAVKIIVRRPAGSKAGPDEKAAQSASANAAYRVAYGAWARGYGDKGFTPAGESDAR